MVGIRSGTPEPHYRLVSTIGPVQIRQYDPRIVAGTLVEGTRDHALSNGFTRLASFIFGANNASASIEMTAPVVQSAASEKIEMTAPVIQSQNAAGVWEIQFIMPAQYTLRTLPKPNNSAITITQLPAQIFAVYRYTGLHGAAAQARARQTLLEALSGSAWHAQAQPVAWFYDPPWTIPWLRRNEAAVNVTKSG